MTDRPRIAVAGFLHETNTFAASRASYASFEEGGGWPGILFGGDVLTGTRDVNVGIAGFVAAPEAAHWELVPILWCAPSPSGPVTDDAFERIAEALIERLQAASPLDGVYLDLHGAMVTDSCVDGEGELLRRIRGIIGSKVPIVASLDLHANVTREMVVNADLLIGFRTYPHVDMAETGGRAATAMARILRNEAMPAAAFRRLPFLIPIIAQCTDLEPCRSIYAALERSELGGTALLNFFPGFPAADFEDCRPSVLAYARSEEAAEALADGLVELVVRREGDFDQPVLEPADAIARARSASRAPVVIADVQDNPGAGASSDTTGILRALVDARIERAAVGLIVDPAAAATAHNVGAGASISIGLGGHSGLPADRPLAADYLVEFLSDGRLETKGPYYGRSPMNLGPSACLRLGGLAIVVTSHKAQMADQEMFRFVGIEPLEQQILVVKSSVHFRAHFAPIAGEILLCRSPGAMPADPVELVWTKLAEGVRTRPNGSPFTPSRGRPIR